MKRALIGLLVAIATLATPAMAQLSFGFSGHGVSIGVNVPVYPVLQPVPGYPVYYAPSLNANYFFYDGLYWVFDGVTWYQSSWYNGPWYAVDPYAVPVYLLRVPVRYYRHAPAYFHGWAYDSAPRWGDHWGHAWESRRAGWDRWNRSSAPAAAPLPTYQRAYSGSRYPRDVQQQATIQQRSYSYRPREEVSRQRFEQRVTAAPQVAPVQPAPAQTQAAQAPMQRADRQAQATQRQQEQFAQQRQAQERRAQAAQQQQERQAQVAQDRPVQNMQRQEQRFAQRAQEREGRAAENMQRQQEHFAQKQLEQQQRQAEHQQRQAEQQQRQAERRAERQDRGQQRGQGRGHENDG